LAAGLHLDPLWELTAPPPPDHRDGFQRAAAWHGGREGRAVKKRGVREGKG